MEWIGLIRDARAMGFFVLVALGVLYLLTSPNRREPHVCWISSCSAIYGTTLLLHLLSETVSAGMSMVLVFCAVFLTALAIMALTIGLMLYGDRERRVSQGMVLITLLVPTGVVLLGAMAVPRTPHWQHLMILCTVTLSLVPALTALNIYRRYPWKGHLLLFLVLFLVPVSRVVAGFAWEDVAAFRAISFYPAAAAMIIAFGLLNFRDSQELGARIHELHEAREKLEDLASHLEETVRQRTLHLEAVIEGLKHFNAIVSHDLRAPLRNAAGMVDYAVDEIRAGNIEAAVDALDAVRNHSQRGLEMVSNLLRLSSLEETAIQVKLTDMNAVFASAMDLLRADYPAIDSAVQMAPLPQVEADPGLMQHVALNLLSNALKYGQGVKGLQVSVAAQQVAPGQWRFEVADNGPGFDSDHAASIFEPFVRIPGTKQPGTGVGLTIVARIIERHRGKIGATAQPGQGARFWWTLPERQMAPA